ncbi:MAG TPA: LysM peptidoglycan-binding domain-containing protein, partial [Tepidisphaeraceae bacterium]
LGVAAVYGAMALLTSRGDAAPTDEGAQSTLVDGATGDVVVGLPPPEADIVPVATPANPPVNPPVVAAAKPVDPFAESGRNDGSTSDPWTTALVTGRVPSAGKSREVVVTRTPDLAKPDAAKADGQKPDAGKRVSVLPVANVATGERESGQRANATDEPKRDAAAPAVEGKKYKIAPGDTFSSIAAKAYGDRNLYQSIINANPGVDPARMKVGTEIVLPPVETVKNERGSLAAPARPETGAIDTTREYRVQSGDTLHGISKKLYGRTAYWMAIYDLNKAAIGNDAGRLKLGTVLALPQRPDAR